MILKSLYLKMIGNNKESVNLVVEEECYELLIIVYAVNEHT